MSQLTNSIQQHNGYAIDHANHSLSKQKPTLKKPTRLPPAPPPPPLPVRADSPARSFSALTRHSDNSALLGSHTRSVHDGSEYECVSLCSVPLSSKPSLMRASMGSSVNSNYHSCSEMACIHAQQHAQWQNYLSPEPKIRYDPSPSICSCSMAAFHCSSSSIRHVRPHSPCRSTHSEQVHLVCSQRKLIHSHCLKPLPPLPQPQSSPSSCVHRNRPLPQPQLQKQQQSQPKPQPQPPSLAQPKQQPQEHQRVDVTDGPSAERPPVPMARSSRKRSTSPIPALKDPSSQAIFNDPRYQGTYTPLHYRRLIELDLERLFKYISDRKEREDKCEAEIADRNDQTNEQTFRRMLAVKETQHLRSLRRRMSPKDFREIKVLGSGYFGVVSLVEQKSIDEFNGKPATNQLFAMKKLRKSHVIRQNHTNHVIAERDILAEADSEWIVKLYYSFQDTNHLYFILDYVPGGDMMNLLYKFNTFPEISAQFYIAEISLALQFVHDMGFVHRDIKPDNILIDASGHIKLTDFGLCTGFRWTHDSSYYKDDTLNGHDQDENHLSIMNGDCNSNENSNGTANSNGNGFHHDDHPTITKALTKRQIEHSSKRKVPSFVGSTNYMAPEVLPMHEQSTTNFDEKLCDWWSVGVILYEMVIGYCPFIDLVALKTIEGYHPELELPIDTYKRIINWKKNLAFPRIGDPESPPLQTTKQISPVTESLIKCLLCDHEKRLCSVYEIKQHPFFDGFDWENIRKIEPPFIPELKNEYDTSNFDGCMVDNGFNPGSGTTTTVQMNGFTYKPFWTPCPKGQISVNDKMSSLN